MTRTLVSGMPKKSDHTRKDTQEIHETCCSGKPPSEPGFTPGLNGRTECTKDANPSGCGIHCRRRSFT